MDKNDNPAKTKKTVEKPYPYITKNQSKDQESPQHLLNPQDIRPSHPLM
jgi:hypothetical protein